MSKVLALVNLELKRSKRFLVFYTVFFSFMTLALNLIQMNRLKKREYAIDNIMDSSRGGITYGIGIINNNMLLGYLIVASIVGILIYSMYTWIRDINGTNKSIYTLIMIPENKYTIYLSRVMFTIVGVYTMVVCHIGTIYLSKMIFNKKFSYLNIIDSSIREDLGYRSIFLKRIIPTNLIDFMMNYGVFLILIASLVSTLSIIYLCFKDDRTNLLLISALIIFGFYNISELMVNDMNYIGFIEFEVRNLWADLGLWLGLISVLHIVSSKLINKRFYI